MPYKIGHIHRIVGVGLVAILLASTSAASLANPATTTTVNKNRAVLDQLPFADRDEFADAARGFLRKPETLTIRGADGNIVWDLESYKSFITLDAPAPDSVNPSLWRNAQLNLQYGLFEVVDGIYQVRGYDLSNITFVRGDTGWIVFDVGTSKETSKAAYELLTEQFGPRPIAAVVYSHSHLDHFAGVKGLVSEEDVATGKVRIIAPEGFMEHAVSEGVIAGNAMSRRAIYMYGALLPRNAEGSVGSGLGLTNPLGTATLIPPTDTISADPTTLTIDGVEMEFQLTPGTEAPAEMNTYLPKWRAMWMAENTTATMHNILTLRGAQVRDALAWANYINETINRYGGKIDVKFQSHHWPKWGKGDVVEYLKKQRDVYKFIHDRSVNLMNKGYTGEEIAELIKLPKSLEGFWPARGYYGTLKHNARAVYQRYMGWYDGNPVNLDVLPPVDAAKKYVEYMGGAPAILEKARGDYAKGEYRWVAMVVKQVVFADPSNGDAKALLADALEQMGFQAESGPWRSVYLQGAYELRNGTKALASAESGTIPDVIRAMTPEMLFDYLAVRLDADRAEGKTLSVAFDFTDLNKRYTLTVENSVLVYSDNPSLKADATATLSKAVLDRINLGELKVEDGLKSGDIKIDGDSGAFASFFGMLDTFDFNFNIVTP